MGFPPTVRKHVNQVYQGLCTQTGDLSRVSLASCPRRQLGFASADDPAVLASLKVKPTNVLKEAELMRAVNNEGDSQCCVTAAPKQ